MINILGMILLKVVKKYAWKIADDVLDEIITEATSGKDTDNKAENNDGKERQGVADRD